MLIGIQHGRIHVSARMPALRDYVEGQPILLAPRGRRIERMMRHHDISENAALVLRDLRRR
jgi:uncharacterized membrane protein YcaP (DUF421 family)